MTPHPGLTPVQRTVKRGMDVCVAITILALAGWLIGLLWVVVTIATRRNGFFTQERVGRGGERFRIVKLRTMRSDVGHPTTVTVAGDPRITRLGRWLRRTKLDELPQLFNVLRGDMSLVGPRPDVPGWFDALSGDDRRLLCLRPGITGPATLRFANEEELLRRQPDPEAYNRHVLFPAKVRMNLDYLDNYSIGLDLRLIAATILPQLRSGDLAPAPDDPA